MESNTTGICMKSEDGDGTSNFMGSNDAKKILQEIKKMIEKSNDAVILKKILQEIKKMIEKSKAEEPVKFSIEESGEFLGAEGVNKETLGAVLLLGLQALKQPRPLNMTKKRYQHLKKEVRGVLEWFDAQYPNDTYDLLQHVLESMNLSGLPEELEFGNKAVLIDTYISQVCEKFYLAESTECLLKQMESLLENNSSDNTWPHDLKIPELRGMVESYKSIELEARLELEAPHLVPCHEEIMGATCTLDGKNASFTTDSSASSGSYESDHEVQFPPGMQDQGFPGRDDIQLFGGQGGGDMVFSSESTTCPLSELGCPEKVSEHTTLVTTIRESIVELQSLLSLLEAIYLRVRR